MTGSIQLRLPLAPAQIRQGECFRQDGKIYVKFYFSSFEGMFVVIIPLKDFSRVIFIMCYKIPYEFKFFFIFFRMYIIFTFVYVMWVGEKFFS